jgi:PAS domain-containing protein
MKPHSRVHHDVAPTWPEQMLEEIIRQLPLGLIWTDLEGEILFMNAAAQELLAFESPAGEYENHARAQRLPAQLANLSRKPLGRLPCRDHRYSLRQSSSNRGGDASPALY